MKQAIVSVIRDEAAERALAQQVASLLELVSSSKYS